MISHNWICIGSAKTVPITATVKEPHKENEVMQNLAKKKYIPNCKCKKLDIRDNENL